MSTKKRVLETLEKNKGSSFSGASLARELGVSRTAVWKSINALRDEGHQITANSGKGYSLSENSDLLTVEGISPLLKKPMEIQVFTSIDSTNKKAKLLSLENPNCPLLVVANQQTEGRGRLGRDFYSPADTGIYLSLLIKPNFDMSKSVLITSAASVAVIRAIRNITGKEGQIKWVNDIYLDNKKVCGILTEAVTDFENGHIQYVILGIGINCFTESFPKELRPIAGSLNGNFSRNALAAEIVNELISIIDNIESRDFMKEYIASSMVMGKNILVYNAGYTSESIGKKATVLNIDENGGLVVKYQDGKKETLSTGEISIRMEHHNEKQ